MPDVIWHTWSLISSLNVHKASSLREFYANKSATIYRLLLPSVLQLCGLQKLKISLREFFVHKNATRVYYYEAALHLFYNRFLQVSLFVDVYKKKQETKKNF